MVVGTGSSWLVYIRCSAQALKSVRVATEAIVQPIGDKLFQQTNSLPRKVVYFCADDKAVKASGDLFTSLSNLSFAIYGHQTFSAPGLDARLLLPVDRNQNSRLAFDSVDKVLFCQSEDEKAKKPSETKLPNLIGRQFSPVKPESVTFCNIGKAISDEMSVPSKVGYREHEEVCLGGTFDRLHAGHKQLLTAACLACSRRLTIGVLTGPMIERKTLFELMEPVEKRIENVQQFVKDIDPSIQMDIVPITDAFGPSIVIENLGVLVVSKETMRGGERVNEERIKRGLSPALLYAIELLGEPDASIPGPKIGFAQEDSLDGDVPKPPIEEEAKVSSSTQRFNLLGELLRPPNLRQTNGKPDSDSPVKKPYVIGLSGGIASGKTSVSNRLEKMGAIIVDCDNLGHEIYKKNSPGFSEIVAKFGGAIVNEETGEIDRRKLGSIVFGDKAAMCDLCGITWPRIAERVGECVEDVARKDEQYNKEHPDAPPRRSVIVVNAAVLYEANWDAYFNEIWLCIVPPDTELKRVIGRDKLSEADAKQRIAAQISNVQRVSRSHVVISTLWRRSVTQYQVEKAWKLLQQRLK